MKLGWIDGGDNVKLAYKDESSKSLDFRQNSLVMMAEIRRVGGDKVPQGDLRMRQVTITFEGPYAEHAGSTWLASHAGQANSFLGGSKFDALQG